MQKALLIFFLLTSVFLSMSAQSTIYGTWKTIDDKDGKPASYVEIFEKDGKAFGKVTKLFDLPEDTLCEECEGDLHNKPVVGMQILSNLKQNGNVWSGGKVLDPEDGNTYKCKITLNNDNTLSMRGYIGIPALGRTQTWHRLD